MDPPDAGLFVAALTCATTIEFLAMVENPSDDKGAIARWLGTYLAEFRAHIGNETLAHFFERRYRHQFAHKAYVSLGRLGDMIPSFASTEKPSRSIRCPRARHRRAGLIGTLTN